MYEEYKIILEQALKAGEQREYAKSIEYLLEILKKNYDVPEALLYLGRSYHALGKFSLAINSYKMFIEQQPDQPAGYFFLGRTYISSGLYKLAVPCLEKALIDKRNESKIFSLLGLSYLKLKKPEISVKYFEQAITKEPENKRIYTAYLNAMLINAIKNFNIGNKEMAGQMFEFIQTQGNENILTYLYLAQIKKEQENYTDSLRYYEKALLISPNDKLIKLNRAILYYKLGFNNKAVEEFEKIKNIFPNIITMEMTNEEINRFMAKELFNNKKYKRSIIYIKEILRKNPDDIEMKLLLGEIFRILGEYKKAKNQFLNLKNNFPNMLEAYYGLAAVYWCTEKYKNMIVELKKILEMDSDNNFANYYFPLCYSKIDYNPSETIKMLIHQIKQNDPDSFLSSALGTEYLKLNEIETASEWFEESLSINVSNKDALLGNIQINKIKNNFEQLIKSYKDYLEYNKNDRKTRNQFIFLLIKKKKYKDAISEILKYLPNEKNEIKLLKLLGFCYRKINKFKQAIIIYKQLIMNDYKNQKYLINLIYCYWKSEQIEKATEILKEAVKYINPDSNTYSILGILLKKQSFIDEALKYFNKAVIVDPKNWQIYKHMSDIYKEKGITDIADTYLKKSDYYKTYK